MASWIRSDPGQRVRLVQTARDLIGLRAVPRPPADVVILDLELSGELVTTQIPGLVAAGYRVVAFSGHSDPVPLENRIRLLTCASSFVPEHRTCGAENRVTRPELA